MSRFDDQTQEIDGPESAFATVNGGYSSSKLAFKFKDRTDAVQYQKIGDDAWSSTLGNRRPRQGLADGTFSFMSEPHGQGTAAGDGDQAAETPLGRKLACALGAAQDRSTGDLTDAAAHTETAVTMTTAGRHDADQIAAFTVGGSIYVRPIASRSSAVLTLGMGLPSAPDSGGGELVYGAENVAWTDDPSYSATLRAISDSTYRHRQFRGCVFDFELQEAGEGEIPDISWTGRCVDFDRLSDTSGFSQTEPSDRRAKVVAGGQYLIAANGSAQTPKDIDFVRASLTCNGGWARKPGPNNSHGFDSTFGWRRNRGEGVPFEMTLHVSHDFTPPAGVGSSSFEEMADAQLDADVLQVLLAFGRSEAGRIFAVWARHLYVAGWEMVNLDGLAAQKLTLRVQAGYATTPLVCATL